VRLTPLDIRKQEFRRVMRGFDPLEVEAFLDMVADEYEAALKRRNEVAEKVKGLEEELKNYRRMEKNLKDTLLEAQESLKQTRESSQKEADLLIKEAELKAYKILEDSRLEVERLKNEILILKSQKESFAKRLKHILQSQVELIKVLEMDDEQVEAFRSEKIKIKPKTTSASTQDSVSVSEKKPTERSEQKREPVPAADKAEKKVKEENRIPDDDSAFDVVGREGKSREKNDRGLIERMVLEIDEEEDLPFDDDLPQKPVKKPIPQHKHPTDPPKRSP